MAMYLRIVLGFTCIVLISGCSGSSGQDETTALDDNYNFASSGLISIAVGDGVLGNDKGEELVAELVVGPSQSDGFVFNSNGSFSYTALAESVTTDQFEYQITGKDELTQTALVTINVYPKPISKADEYRVYVGKTSEVSAKDGVLANDDLNRNNSQSIIVREPTQAESFTLNKDGSFSYKPSATAAGVDSFSYMVQDDLQRSDEQEVELVIDSGVFSGEDDSFEVESGKILSLQPLQGVLKNDDGLQDATVVVQKLPRHAIDFSITGAGLLNYRTVTESESKDSFSYTLHKNTRIIGPFEVTVHISQPTEASGMPWFYDQCKEYQAGENVDGAISGLGIAEASFELVSQPRFGELTSFDGTTGQFSYARNTRSRGQDAFSYRIYNANGGYVADASQELIALPYRVMPVGDSITSGVEFYDSELGADTPASDKRVGYRKSLKDELSALGYSIDLVGTRNEGYNVSSFNDSQHNGFPGVSDTYVSNNIEQWLDTNSADIILMHIGTNATKNHISNISAIGTKIDNWEQREDNPVTVMMAKLIARTDHQTGSDAVRIFNGLIEEYVEEQIESGDRIRLVDQYDALGEGSYLSADKLHPRAEGYQVMSQEWIKRLQETRAIAKCD